MKVMQIVLKLLMGMEERECDGKTKFPVLLHKRSCGHYELIINYLDDYSFPVAGTVVAPYNNLSLMAL